MLTFKGYEYLGHTGSGSLALTIPSGTTHVVVSSNRGPCSAMSVGGVSLTSAASGKFWHGSIAGRSSDALALTTSDGTSRHIAIYYLSARDLQVLSTGSESASSGWHSKTSATPPVSGGNAWGAIMGYGSLLGAFDLFDDAETYNVAGTPANTGNAAAHVSPAGAADATVTVGIHEVNDFLSPGTIDWAFFHEASPGAVQVVEDAPGAEAGIPAGVEVTVGPVMQFGHTYGIGAEAGVPSGIRVTAEGPAQVLLAVPRFDRPQMTEGGTEGQVLTFHAKAKPTWEDPTGGDLTSLVIDASVSGAHTADRADGATHDLTLTGDATITPDHSDPVAGEAIDLRLLIRQDGTGGRTLGWGGTITWAGGSAPTMPTDANAMLTVGLLSVDDAATWLGYVADATATVALSDTVEDETAWGVSPSAGTSDEAARGDHTHGSPAEPTGGGIGPLLLASDHSSPIVFDDILQASDGSDFLYASE